MKRISIKMCAAMLLLLLAMVGITGTGMFTANEAVAAESEVVSNSNLDQLAISRTSLSKTNRDTSRCVIPASGPWPACATGGGGSGTGSGSGACVIPASGPWPACATNGGGSGGGSAGSGSGDCVIPASGPWPACASGGGGSGGGATPAQPAPAATEAEKQPLSIRTGNLSYFAFDETGRSILDSNTGNTGSISPEVKRISGPRNGALSMNGSGSIFIPDGPNVTVGTGDFSIALWVRLSKADGVQRILDKRSTGGALAGYHLFTADGKLGIQLADGQGNINSCNSDAGAARCTNYITKRFIADGQWHFIAITVDRNRERGLKFYVDNILRSVQDPRDRQGSLDSSQNVPLVMDAAPGAPLDVDELYVYGKVLSTDQIAFLHRNR